MVRGKKTFSEIFDEPVIQQKSDRRGRSKTLIYKRNECICYRYYYYGKIKKLQFTDVIKLIAEEMYLMESTVAWIMQCNQAEIREILKEKLSIKQLDDKFSHLKWTNK